VEPRPFWRSSTFLISMGLQPYAAANKSWGNFANWVTP